LSLHAVVETPEFSTRARRLLSRKEIDALIGYRAANPAAGVRVPGTGGARKLRWSARGKGKSGGVRVIPFFSGASIPVFLLTIFGKAEQADLTSAQRGELRRILTELVTEYGKGMSRYVQVRRRHS
jgi:hypothetical protein